MHEYDPDDLEKNTYLDYSNLNIDDADLNNQQLMSDDITKMIKDHIPKDITGFVFIWTSDKNYGGEVVQVK